MEKLKNFQTENRALITSEDLVKLGESLNPDQKLVGGLAGVTVFQGITLIKAQQDREILEATHAHLVRIMERLFV